MGEMGLWGVEEGGGLSPPSLSLSLIFLEEGGGVVYWVNIVVAVALEFD